jgi:hypothetical protein
MPQRVQRQCVLTAQVGPTSRPFPCATTACRLLRVPPPLAPSRSRRCGGVHRCKHSKKKPKEKTALMEPLICMDVFLTMMQRKTLFFYYTYPFFC